MENTGAAFARLSRAVVDEPQISYPLAELNDLLTSAGAQEILQLPRPEIEDAYRLNYVTAMVEVAAHRADVLPPAWTAEVEPSTRLFACGRIF
jgi:hypothetical protein